MVSMKGEAMNEVMRPCIVCGDPTCEEHVYSSGPRKGQRRLADKNSRGYDKHWTRLSERARKAQPFCSDCGTRDDLTTDHTPEAWARHAAGKPIRLRDVDVVCRSCNIARGSARGAEVTAKAFQLDRRSKSSLSARPRGVGQGQNGLKDPQAGAHTPDGSSLPHVVSSSQVAVQATSGTIPAHTGGSSW